MNEILSPEMVETLVLRFRDDLCEDQNQSSLKIMKLTSELAKLSCHHQTLQSFQTSGFTSISFTVEERNIFARLQILSNQIRKTHNFHEIPLYHLSPRLVLSSVLSIEKFQELSSEKEYSQKIIEAIPKKKKKNSKMKQSKSKSNPPKLSIGDPDLRRSEPTAAIIEADSSTNRESIDISPSPPRPQKISVDEPLQTTFFSEQLDPADMNGWVPVLNKKKDAMGLSPNRNPTGNSSSSRSCPPPSQQTPRSPSHSSSPSKPKSRARSHELSIQMTDPPNTSLPRPSSFFTSSPSGCQNCISLQNALSRQESKHSTDLQLLRSQYEAEIQNLRELHSQAIQSLQLKLFISNNNLEIEREERNKIIEEMLSKYPGNGSYP
jgi:hypothetical protein